MDCVLKVCADRKLDTPMLESECANWVVLLLEMVDYTDEEAEVQLKCFSTHSMVLKSKYCQEKVLSNM